MGGSGMRGFWLEAGMSEVEKERLWVVVRVGECASCRCDGSVETERCEAIVMRLTCSLMGSSLCGVCSGVTG